MSGASERANGRASDPVLTSQFLFVPDHSAMGSESDAVGSATDAMGSRLEAQRVKMRCKDSTAEKPLMGKKDSAIKKGRFRSRNGKQGRKKGKEKQKIAKQGKENKD